MLMLNLIELAPGQGIFLQPRTLHAYLTGVGVEIMAGSDNVLRCGLTPKHIDTDELLSVLDFSHGSLDPTPITALSAVEDAWITPTPEFRLSRLVVGSEPVQLSGGVPQILVCTEGAVTFGCDGDTLNVTGGQAVFIPASSAGVRVTAPSHGVVFRAVPGL
jgi:mannose-6-phosphate isomerase